MHANLTIKKTGSNTYTLSGSGKELWNWLSGYMTAVNIVLKGKVNNFGMGTYVVVNWVASFCRDYPKNDLSGAVWNLLLSQNEGIKLPR